MLHKNIFAGLALCLAATTPATAATTLQLDAAATYLRTSDYPGYVAHGAFAYSLGSLGFAAGDTITLTRFGEYQGIIGGTDTSGSALVAVFSSSNILLGSTYNGSLYVSPEHRVTGALATTLPAYLTKNSYHGVQPADAKMTLSTDIAEDFFISKTGTTVLIPTNAQYVFFTVDDNLFGDNSDPNGNLTVSIAAAVAVPEPAGWAMMGVGFALAGFAARRKQRA